MLKRLGLNWQKSAVALLISCGVVFGMQDTGVDRMDKWRLMPPCRDLLSAGAGEINAMKHLARGGGVLLTLNGVDTRSMPYG